jgi:glucose-1-phosphate adenylyltransferase
MKIISIILGGGAGSRLFPLTLLRAKPAVPFGGYLRLIDIPLSNCINSKINKIFVLTQFNSESLNRHLAQTYRFDLFSKGWVDILAASLTQDKSDWYQGTADAVRQNLRHFQSLDFENYLILAGDHIYRMDYREFLNTHLNSKADVTVACTFRDKKSLSEYGVAEVDLFGRIKKFIEKPKGGILKDLPEKNLVSMGIYIFKRNILENVLQNNELSDFGRDVMPYLLSKGYFLQCHKFDGFWEDVGTIKNYFNSNLILTRKNPPFKLNDPEWLFYTHPRFLGTSKIENSKLENVLLAEGSEIIQSKIKNSIIGLRSLIGKNCEIENSIIMGNDYYPKEIGGKKLGIGENCIIKNAIIDKNSYIGKNSIIWNKKKIKFLDSENFYIRDGILIIPKNSVIKNNSKIP